MVIYLSPDVHICRAKSVIDGKWVYGYYVAAPFDGKMFHLIIEPTNEYHGAGQFDWHGVHRVDPDTVCV